MQKPNSQSRSSKIGGRGEGVLVGEGQAQCSHRERPGATRYIFSPQVGGPDHERPEGTRQFFVKFSLVICFSHFWFRVLIFPVDFRVLYDFFCSTGSFKACAQGIKFFLKGSETFGTYDHVNFKLDLCKAKGTHPALVGLDTRRAIKFGRRLSSFLAPS
jgi:hypothetical protein